MVGPRTYNEQSKGTKMTLEGNLVGRSRKSRPSKRWLDDVQDDVQDDMMKMVVKTWKTKAMERKMEENM
jgi:hypothetical protein